MHICFACNTNSLIFNTAGQNELEQCSIGLFKIEFRNKQFYFKNFLINIMIFTKFDEIIKKVNELFMSVCSAFGSFDFEMNDIRNIQKRDCFFICSLKRNVKRDF